MRQGPLRVYVAGRFTQYERLRAVMDAVTEEGYAVTHDWTRTEEFGVDGHPLVHEQGRRPAEADSYAHHSEDDIRGCRTADAVLAIADEPLTGGLIEIGAALAYGVPVVVVAPWRWTVFWEHPLVKVVSTLDDALGVLALA
jgi:hypothetical protein